MTQRPPLTEPIATALARLFADQTERRDPSHWDIGQKINLAKLSTADPGQQTEKPVGKFKRVSGTLSWAISNDMAAGQTLVDLLTTLVRGSGGFRPQSPNYCGEDPINNLVAAFDTEGWELGLDGVLRPKVLDDLPKAFSIFCEELRSFAGPLVAYERDASLRSASRTWRKLARPTLSTMLKRCHVAGVKLPDVLADPYGAANAAGRLLIDSHPLPQGIKPRRTLEVVKHARMRLIEAISAYPEKPLISFAAFAQSLGVSKGFLSYREPALCKVYKEEYAAQVSQANKSRKRQAKAELTHGRAFLRYLGGEFRSQDELVDYLHASFEVKKHVARLLVSEVLKTHLRIKALSEMPSRSISQRTMLLRGRAAGYL
jgi:hypothetical protein